MTEVKADYDKSWKEALNEYFDSFLSFFFPNVHGAINWTQPPESQDKELQQIIGASETEDGVADKLFKVKLLDQREIWILIHIEIQSNYDVNFERRMYKYNYRAEDLYDKPVISLAILGDTSPTWRPDRYTRLLLDCEHLFRFPMVKLLDYESRWHELESDNNPFAIIAMAHLKTKATIGNLTEREAWKWQIIRSLYERGLNKVQINKLYGIIDRMMTLSKELQAGLIRKIKVLEEERQMPFISPTEEIAREEGELIGELKGKQDLVIKLFSQRFGAIEQPLVEKIRQLSGEQLEELTNVWLTLATLADLERWLQSRLKPTKEE